MMGGKWTAYLREMILNNKIWLITGASRGFGRVWAEAALDERLSTREEWETVSNAAQGND